MDGDMYGCIGGRVEKEKEKKKKKTRLRNGTTEHLQWTQRQDRTPLRRGGIRKKC